MAAERAKRSWEHLSDQDLLKVRICDLGVRLEESDLPARIAQLYDELSARKLRLEPVFYLADEWFTPNHAFSVGIPFYLAHPRLRALEFRMMFEVEGGSRSWCMRLMRHETGHALDHAYKLHTRPDWEAVFGSPRVRYAPERYLVDPKSKGHVRNLPDDYAQSHPEEDFAETFAVWLNPSSQWRTRYAGWPAMRKLRYVDRLMRELRSRPAPRRKPVFASEARGLRSTLKSYYERKYRMYELNDLSFTVPTMRAIFRAPAGARGRGASPAAARLIREHKQDLVAAIAAWSGERRGSVARVVTNLARLCDEHGLLLRDSAERSLVRISTFAATLVLNHLHTHRYRIRKP